MSTGTRKCSQDTILAEHLDQVTYVHVFLLACVQARQIVGEGKLEKSIGNLLYHTATRFKGSETRRIFLLTYICSVQIATEQQLTGVYVYSVNVNLLNIV